MTTGVLSWPDMRMSLQLNTGFFETSQYTYDNQMFVCSGNHDGAGMSAGTLQYNFGAANRLTVLWQYMITNYEQLCIDTFGAYTTEYNTWKTALMSANQADRISFGALITDPNNDHAIIQPYKDCLGNLLLTPESKAKYDEIMDSFYIPDPVDLFKQLSCISRAALGCLFDLSINRGRFYPCNVITAEFEEIDANEALTDVEKEAEKIRKISYHGNDTTNAMAATSAQWFVQRRTCQAEQGGTYYGNVYDPEVQFDINQEPALAEKTSFQLGVKLGEFDVSNIYLGTAPVSSIYLGANLLGGAPTPYTSDKIPNTQFRTNPNSYAGFEGGAITLDAGSKIWVDVQNWCACKTYYTLDGSTPTENSTLYNQDGIVINESLTLKTLTVSVAGIAEEVKTATITIPVEEPAGGSWRYLRILGYGTSFDATTRIIEFEAWEGATNRMAGRPATAITWTTPNNTVVPPKTSICDGVKVTTSNTYPFWWTPVPNANVVIDLGAEYPLTKLNYYSFSISQDQRQNRFKIQASNTNNGTDWVDIWDMSGNVTPQPILPLGYEKIL